MEHVHKIIDISLKRKNNLLSELTEGSVEREEDRKEWLGGEKMQKKSTIIFYNKHSADTLYPTAFSQGLQTHFRDQELSNLSSLLTLRRRVAARAGFSFSYSLARDTCSRSVT